MMVIKIFNTIPKSIRELSLTQFRISLFSLLHNRCFYTTSEFCCLIISDDYCSFKDIANYVLNYDLLLWVH